MSDIFSDLKAYQNFEHDLFRGGCMSTARKVLKEINKHDVVKVESKEFKNKMES